MRDGRPRDDDRGYSDYRGSNHYRGGYNSHRPPRGHGPPNISSGYRGSHHGGAGHRGGISKPGPPRSSHYYKSSEYKSLDYKSSDYKSSDSEKPSIERETNNRNLWTSLRTPSVSESASKPSQAATDTHLDSSRIWAKLLDISVAVPQETGGEMNKVLAGLPTLRCKEKEFIEKFKKDIHDLEEATKKLNEKFLEKYKKEQEYEKYCRYERVMRLQTQLKEDYLESIVNGEAIFTEI